MNKYIVKFSVLFGAIICLLGCQNADDFLDSKSTSDLNEATVFADSARTMDFLANTYSLLKYEVGTSGLELNTFGGSLSDMTDEADTKWPGGHNVGNQIIGGTFGTAFKDRSTAIWLYFYQGIRQVNTYLKNVKESPLSEARKTRTALEARFLRAYFYHKLMCYYGGVVLTGDTIYTVDSPNDVVRSTYEDCVNYIVSELDAIAPGLPLAYSGIEYGRVTRGAALSLKSRVLLYAASPLYNGGGITDDPEVAPLLAYSSADPSRWEKALQAAQAVANLNVYSLYVDNTTRPGNGFYQVFLERVNTEFILQVMLDANKGIESNTNPPSRGGNYYRFPTQEMVDAFPMKNGRPISDPASSGYVESNMYVNRDPRFYFTVIYNGASYFDQRTNNMTPVYTYSGASLDGLKPSSANTGTVTGYYVRKMANENLSATSGGTTYRCPPIFRYAEILLNLAEAANETGNTSLAMEQLITIRQRAGIEPGTDQRYGLPASPSKEEARELIRNERFIELAFEDQRYWDVRRWKLGDQYDGQYVHGINITKSGNTYTGVRFNVRAPRYFKTNSYFFPIPDTEIALNRNIKQNPGW